jgi:hypothetical protein
MKMAGLVPVLVLVLVLVLVAMTKATTIARAAHHSP